MENPVEKARQIIVSNRYLALATCSGETPWVAALAYAVDKDYIFYFYSAKNSLHIEHIKKNPNVAFTIYNSTLPSDEVDGLQIAGIVTQVKLIDLPRVIRLYYEQTFPDEIIRAKWKQPISAFKDVAIKRFYQIKPIKVYKIDLSTTEVDRRIEISLEELCRYPAYSHS